MKRLTLEELIKLATMKPKPTNEETMLLFAVGSLQRTDTIGNIQ